MQLQRRQFGITGCSNSRTRSVIISKSLRWSEKCCSMRSFVDGAVDNDGDPAVHLSAELPMIFKRPQAGGTAGSDGSSGGSRRCTNSPLDATWRSSLMQKHPENSVHRVDTKSEDSWFVWCMTMKSIYRDWGVFIALGIFIEIAVSALFVFVVHQVNVHLPIPIIWLLLVVNWNICYYCRLFSNIVHLVIVVILFLFIRKSFINALFRQVIFDVVVVVFVLFSFTV